MDAEGISRPPSPCGIVANGRGRKRHSFEFNQAGIALSKVCGRLRPRTTMLDCGKQASTPGARETKVLKAGRKAHGDAARRPDCVAGEKAAEIDDIQDVIKVLPVDLKLHIHVVGLIYESAR